MAASFQLFRPNQDPTQDDLRRLLEDRMKPSSLEPPPWVQLRIERQKHTAAVNASSIKDNNQEPCTEIQQNDTFHVDSPATPQLNQSILREVPKLPVSLSLYINTFLASPISPRLLCSVVGNGPMTYPFFGGANAQTFFGFGSIWKLFPRQPPVLKALSDDDSDDPLPSLIDSSDSEYESDASSSNAPDEIDAPDSDGESDAPSNDIPSSLLTPLPQPYHFEPVQAEQSGPSLSIDEAHEAGSATSSSVHRLILPTPSSMPCSLQPGLDQKLEQPAPTAGSMFLCTHWKWL